MEGYNIRSIKSGHIGGLQSSCSIALEGLQMHQMCEWAAGMKHVRQAQYHSSLNKCCSSKLKLSKYGDPSSGRDMHCIAHLWDVDSCKSLSTMCSCCWKSRASGKWKKIINFFTKEKKPNQNNPTKPLYPITFFWSMWNSLTLRFTGWIDIKWLESVRCQLGFALYQTVPLLLCLEWVAAQNAVLLFRAIVWTWYNPKMLPTQLIMSQDSGMKEFLWASWFIT